MNGRKSRWSPKLLRANHNWINSLSNATENYRGIAAAYAELVRSQPKQRTPPPPLIVNRQVIAMEKSGDLAGAIWYRQLGRVLRGRPAAAFTAPADTDFEAHNRFVEDRMASPQTIRLINARRTELERERDSAAREQCREEQPGRIGGQAQYVWAHEKQPRLYKFAS